MHKDHPAPLPDLMVSRAEGLVSTSACVLCQACLKPPLAASAEASASKMSWGGAIAFAPAANHKVTQSFHLFEMHDSGDLHAVVRWTESAVVIHAQHEHE